MAAPAAVIFDLDGTLLDSDAALVAAFVRFGLPAEEVTFGHVLTHECERLGIDVEDYIAAYDPADVKPFPGVPEMLAAIPRWAVASHKDRTTGRAEVAALGWTPECAFFTQDFGGTKRLDVVLDALGVGAADAAFVGDTVHDRAAAQRCGIRYVAAGWNPRCEIAEGDIVAATPAEVLEILNL